MGDSTAPPLLSQALGYISPQLSPTVLLLVCLAKRVPSSVLGSREGRIPGAGDYLGWFLRSLPWRMLLLGVKFDPGMWKGKPLCRENKIATIRSWLEAQKGPGAQHLLEEQVRGVVTTDSQG